MKKLFVRLRAKYWLPIKWFFSEWRDARNIIQMSYPSLVKQRKMYQKNVKQLLKDDKRIQAADYAGRIRMIDEVLSYSKYVRKQQ
jgi:hypothetical protein